MIPNHDDVSRGLDDVVVRKSVHSYVNPEDVREVKKVTEQFNAQPEQSKDAPVIRGGHVYADRDVREAHTDAGRVPRFEDEDATVATNIGSLEHDGPETDQDKPVEGDVDDSVAPSGNEEVEEDSVPEGTVNEVNEWVDGDADRARRALDAENARSKPRKSLVEDLNNVIGE
jgi:hypothetical protein